ncbi:MAG: carboxymuconolactone decarboxylase family protein [Sedimentisphaerales bacterium]
MNRREIYNEMEETLGLVPSFFKRIPDSSLEEEWELFKRIEFDESPIPNKYRELIGLAISGVTKCRAARLFGATEEEIENAAHYAKWMTGWSTYVNTLDIDLEQFKDEVTKICEHVRSAQPVMK